MLRITVVDGPGSVTFRLEGRLAGPWVRELEECWQKAVATRSGASVCFDLNGVTYVDAAGRALLAAGHGQGVELVASCCLMKGVVADVANDMPNGG